MKALLGLFLILLSGCVAQQQTAQSKEDEKYYAMWNSRLGLYTWSDVVSQYGPPSNKESLANGAIVGVWGGDQMGAWSGEQTYAMPSSSFYNRQLHMFTTVGGGTHTVVERMVMTFDKDGVLRDWHYNRK